MSATIWECSTLALRLADGTTVSGAGQVVLDEFGGLELHVSIPGKGHLHLADIADAQVITGQTIDGMTVDAPRCWPIRTSRDADPSNLMAVFSPDECRLTAPTVTGSWTKREYYLKGVRCRGLTRANDDGRVIELSQLPWLDPEDRRRGLVRGLVSVLESPSGGTDPLELRRDLLTIISLAQRCQITAPREDAFVGNALASTLLRSSEFTAESTHPLVPPSPPELGAFLAQTLPALRAQVLDYELERLVWYYCRAFTEPYSEARFIFGSVFMEALKFAWARNVRRYPEDLKSNGLVRGFIKSHNKNGDPVLFNFEELMKGVAAHLGYTTVFTFIEDRNALFHTGAAGAAQRSRGSTWSALKPELWKLYDQMDDLLLRILGYNGPIHPYADPDKRISFPARTVLP